MDFSDTNQFQRNSFQITPVYNIWGHGRDRAKCEYNQHFLRWVQSFKVKGTLTWVCVQSSGCW